MSLVNRNRQIRTLILLGLLAPTARAEDRRVVPRSPAEEAATFCLADSALNVELVASDPNVLSPVAAAWDETGRMFVAEMTDYPASPTGGRVRLLEDRDGDGVYEHASVYADGLPFPNSVLPYRNGVLVTAAPNLWYLQDTNGDGQADHRRVLLTGFGEGNTQLRANGLSWGLDNWVYGANGRSDGALRRPDDPAENAVHLGTRNFRFRPDTGEVQAVSGFSQFGFPRDDWGNRYPSWNTVPIRHVVLEGRTLSRNPFLADSSTVAEILDASDGNRLFPIGPAQTTFNRESVSTFNANCGLTIYRGDLLGESYRGNAFMCESLTNLVHRRALKPVGPTFVATRVEQGKEFLASTDPAFRPVNLANGPDGALYVIDFYREMVEHPEFVTPDLRKSVDFRRWDDRGRIWRIRPAQGPTATGPLPIARPGRATTTELVALLADSNGWTRDTAQRLLVERRDPSAVGPLIAAAHASTRPLGRLHALATLDGLGSLDDPTLAQALRDPHAGVREAAARLAAGRQGLAPELVALADDPEVRVRFQAAIALGDLPGDQAAAPLARIAARDVADPWVTLAVLSGLRETASPFLSALLDAHPDWLAEPPAGADSLLNRAAAILAARDRPGDVEGLATRLAPTEGPQRGRIALLTGLTDGLTRVGKSPRSLLEPTTPGRTSLATGVDALLGPARLVVETPTVPAESRAEALRLLASLRPEVAATLIPLCLNPDQPAEVQTAAAEALAHPDARPLIPQVFARWAGLGRVGRRELLNLVLGTPALVPSLLDAIEAGSVDPLELDAIARDRLARHPDPATHARIAALLAKSALPDRSEVLRQYQTALTLPGDPRRGAELFAKTCQTCHQNRGAGHRVGPDLTGVGGRPPQALLSDILDPNRNISPDSVMYLVSTKQGQVLSGLLVEETATSLKLRQAEGVETTVLHSQVEESRASGRSLMPEGLEQTLGVQGIADLMAFLRQP